MTDRFETEHDLLTAAKKLESRALAAIHDRYYPELYRYALYRTGQPGVAEDIASDVLMRLLDALHHRRPPQTTLRGWLFAVAANRVADHFRQRPTVELDEALPAPSVTAAEAEANLQQASVRAALHNLTHEQQNVLALRFADGFSVEETAQALNKTVNAVKALQFRALEALKRALNPLPHD